MRYLADANNVKPLRRKVKKRKSYVTYIKDCSRMFHALTIDKAREMAYSYAINLQKAVPPTWTAGKDQLAGFSGGPGRLPICRYRSGCHVIANTNGKTERSLGGIGFAVNLSGLSMR